MNWSASFRVAWYDDFRRPVPGGMHAEHFYSPDECPMCGNPWPHTCYIA